MGPDDPPPALRDPADADGDAHCPKGTSGTRVLSLRDMFAPPPAAPPISVVDCVVARLGDVDPAEAKDGPPLPPSPPPAPPPAANLNGELGGMLLVGFTCSGAPMARASAALL